MTDPHDDLASAAHAGHAFIDEAVRLFERAAGSRVTTAKTAAQLAVSFEAGPPDEGLPVDEVLRGLRAAVLDESMQLASPMYMGHQVAPPLPIAAFADALVASLNQSQAVWEMSPAATMIEHRLVRWATDLVGWGSAAGGTFVSGGSAANLTALLAARARSFPDAFVRGGIGSAIIVTGRHAHYSIARAAGIMGLGTDATLAVATNERHALDVVSLAELLVRMRAEGRRVIAVVATAGSTPTGSFDDLAAIAETCRAHDAWLHVDGAHGASALLSPRLAPRLAGIEQADSIAWDPHKMMFQPISTGMLLVRDRALLERTFQQDAPYLFPSSATAQRNPDFGGSTIQCSRRADALRLWIALQVYGVRAIAERFERTVDITQALHRRLLAHADFEPLHEPECNILCFRCTRGDDAFQDMLRAEYNASGDGWITAATVGGRRALRVSIMNPATTEAHLERLLRGLARCAAYLAPGR